MRRPNTGRLLSECPEDAVVVALGGWRYLHGALVGRALLSVVWLHFSRPPAWAEDGRGEVVGIRGLATEEARAGRSAISTVRDCQKGRTPAEESSFARAVIHSGDACQRRTKKRNAVVATYLAQAGIWELKLLARELEFE